ncbi:MAG: hypothetical protein NTX87_17075 [Planctomycetota bacterium]|nr:hypothetical protein [Planctomycetota bacterium]
MKKAKEFDCVRLKDEIQARLTRQWRGLTDEEIRARIRRKLATSRSPIAKLWRALQVRDKKQAKVATGDRAGKRSRRMRSPA